ncbi:MAG: diaminopimelate epimerase [Desulfobacterales bacterium]
MDAIPFVKMSGSGNDFIVIDHRPPFLPEAGMADFVRAVCRRRVSIGADGLILLEPSDRADFRWRFFNADGSTAAMCGNGARCAARFAVLCGIRGPEVCFETGAGLIEARVEGRRVRIRMTDPGPIEEEAVLELSAGRFAARRIDTGVPHAVVILPAVEGLDVERLGAEIRRHPVFAPEGVNADFICPDGRGRIAIRTYERGVEGETLACGTGAVAGALVAAKTLGLRSPVEALTRGGERLRVFFEEAGGGFRNVSLEGEARLIYRGVMTPEAWEPGPLR